MAMLPSSWLQSVLQSAVQSVKWTYSIFWQMCPQQGILIWGDGYYNGPIKTRKTDQPMEVRTEEASLQRSQQLRELYMSLSTGETNQPAHRPYTPLSPEDLTETEWFYLMCVSFSFPPGAGLPGKAYATRQNVWLTGANEVDSIFFSRAILAMRARIQTVVCIPLLDGVVEFGTTERVQEDVSLVNHVKTFFIDHHHPLSPKPALSEPSTSNPVTLSGHHRFHIPPVPTIYTPADPPAAANQVDKEEEENEGESDSEAKTGRQVAAAAQNPIVELTNNAEPSKIKFLGDIWLGSLDNSSNNPDLNFPELTINSMGAEHQRLLNSFMAEATRRWQMMQDPTSGLQTPPSGTVETGGREFTAKVESRMSKFAGRKQKRGEDGSSTLDYTVTKQRRVEVEQSRQNQDMIKLEAEPMYDVFLSFRGLDSFGFADSLYRRLKADGIRVFRDDGKPSTSKELPLSVYSSKIYIPIFSEYYAGSSWCLDALALMVEHTSRSSGKKEILPVFYHVERLDEKLETTTLYRDALDTQRRNWGDEKVERWKKALVEAGKVKRWKLRRYERYCREGMSERGNSTTLFQQKNANIGRLCRTLN